MQDKETAQQLFIPEKLKVGFVERAGTYNGKLAFVIYYDKKGELRREKSWEGWRDKKIAPKELPNEPMDGFVLNKKVGGYKSHWNFRDAHVRVYDPRGFEFEISVPNLLFILMETNSYKGKGLEGKFVYAWDRAELVLLPVNSQDYQNSMKFTNLQDKGVHAKTLVLGASYTTKKVETLTYLGKFDYHFLLGRKKHWHTDQLQDDYPKKDAKGSVKTYVFWNGDDFVFLKDLKSLAVQNSDAVAPDYAELVDKYNKSAHGSKPQKLFLKEKPELKKEGNGGWDRNDDPWYFEHSDGSFIQVHNVYDAKYDAHAPYNRTFVFRSFQALNRFFIEDGILKKEQLKNFEIPKEIKEPTQFRLFVQTEAGGKIRLDKVKYGRYYNTNFDKEI